VSTYRGFVATVLDRFAAPLRGLHARRVARTARDRADAELLASRLPSPRLAWRVGELTSEQNRTRLGRALTNVVHGADESLLPNATPLNRAAVRRNRAALLSLASRMCDLDTPVMPRGLLLVDRLLTDGSGPLYGRGDARNLLREIDRARGALDRDTFDGAAN
jgi:hypothetical protein